MPAKIAEGFGRWNAPDFARFLAIASGSLRKLETHLSIAERLCFAPNDRVEVALRDTNELAKMLYQTRKRVLKNGNRTIAMLNGKI